MRWAQPRRSSSYPVSQRCHAKQLWEEVRKEPGTDSSSGGAHIKHNSALAAWSFCRKHQENTGNHLCEIINAGCPHPHRQPLSISIHALHRFVSLAWAWHVRKMCVTSHHFHFCYRYEISVFFPLLRFPSLWLEGVLLPQSWSPTPPCIANERLCRTSSSGFQWILSALSSSFH